MEIEGKGREQEGQAREGKERDEKERKGSGKGTVRSGLIVVT